jgi:hypothetical protein
MIIAGQTAGQTAFQATFQTGSPTLRQAAGNTKNNAVTIIGINVPKATPIKP